MSWWKFNNSFLQSLNIWWIFNHIYFVFIPKFQKVSMNCFPCLFRHDSQTQAWQKCSLFNMIKNNVNFKGLWNTSTHVHFLYVSIRSGRIFISTLFVPKQLFTTRFMALKAEINIYVVQFIRLLKTFPACIALENLSMVVFGDKWPSLARIMPFPDQVVEPNLATIHGWHSLVVYAAPE